MLRRRRRHPAHVLGATARWPGQVGLGEHDAARSASLTKPWSSRPVVTLHDAGVGRPRRGRRRAGPATSASREHLDAALARAVALGDAATTRQPSASQPWTSATAPLGRRRGTPRGRRARRDAPASVRLVASVGPRRRRTGVTVHHGQAELRSACVADVGEARGSAAAPRSIGACAAGGRVRPGRLEELLRWCGPGRAPGCGPAPGRSQHDVRCPPAARRAAAPCSSASTGASDSMPSTAMPSAIWPSISASSG